MDQHSDYDTLTGTTVDECCDPISGRCTGNTDQNTQPDFD